MAIIELFYYICMTGGALLLCLYLCLMGRFIQRAFHAIVIPYLCIGYFLVIKNLGCLQSSQTSKHQLKRAAVLVSLLITFFIGQVWLTASLEVTSRVNKSNNTIYAENYAMANPDNIYVYDISLTFRYLPFVEYQDSYPSNLIFWGGVGWNSPAFFEQLRINGLDTLYTDKLLEEDVYYITKDDYVPSDISMLARMFAYMASEYPNCQIELIEQLPNNINVYKFYTNQ